MGIQLMVLLLGAYLAIGLMARQYTWRMRAALLLVTTVVPIAFLFFW